ncbi:MAG TPA: extracellular solute-binding protein, partial [Actinomycetota bacterium]|nr:extracellular solute-binding protein [Actinomycetota bacterium]
EHAPISVGEVAQQFGERQGLARTTILTMMERLRKKGYLTRTRERPARYSPGVPQTEVMRGLVREFVEKDALQPIDFAHDAVMENMGEDAVELGSVDGTFYGFLFKAANKSTVWYNVAAFEDAGVEPPETFDDLVAAADTIAASGLPAYSIGAADGWTLTDLFENIYLRQAGAEKYDQLAAHEIPWTDQSVKDALTTMGQIFENKDNIAGNALQIDFPTSVSAVFAEEPKAAMVIEGDFVPGVVESPIEAETGYNVFPFPSVNDSGPMVVGGGDTVVMFSDSPAAQAFISFLATPEAATAWAERGGFGTLNKGVEASVYPDAIQQTTAGALSEAETFRFDLSDLQPAEFGGTVGQGLFKLFQDFYANPSDVDGIAQKMEAAAAKAFG